MKIMAIGTITKPLTPENRGQFFPKEVHETMKHYLDGSIEQFWMREGLAGPIFLMNVDTVEKAKAVLSNLPLVLGDAIKYDFYPCGPLSAIGMLLPQ